MVNKDNPKLRKNGGEGTFLGNALRTLVDVSPELLSIIGAVVPGAEGLTSLIGKVLGDKDTSQENKDVLIAEINKDISYEIQITKRWEADMSSDSWLSKNVRPLGLVWVLVMITTLLIVSWCGINTPVQVLYVFGGTVPTILGGYYVLRTIEKRNEKKYK